jgi:hypothetical protein
MHALTHARIDRSRLASTYHGMHASPNITPCRAEDGNNIFLNSELFVERMNVDKFTLLSEPEFKVKELGAKGSAPRSHEQGLCAT